MNVETVLPVVWFGIIGFGVLMYVLLDGFVLGLGALMAFADDEDQRDLMMNTAAPIWDGNETWLVLGGAGLFAAFPKVYAIILSGLYLPVTAMLLSLVFRGVAFEFRFKAHGTKKLWGAIFAVGSISASFFQGVILGSVVEGMPLKAGHYIGGALDWFSPFSMLTGVAVVFGYALLGATWLNFKTEDRMQMIARDMAKVLVVCVMAFMFLVSVWLPFLDSHVMQRWFAWPSLLWLSPIPLLTAVIALRLWMTLRDRHEWKPFAFAQGLFGMGFLGLLVGLWPNLVPPNLSIWDAAAPPESQGFSLVGAVILLPAVVAYTFWSYKVFHGKVAIGHGYH